MLTTIFAFICIFAGILSFIVGGFGTWALFLQENPVQFRQGEDLVAIIELGGIARARAS